MKRTRALLAFLCCALPLQAQDAGFEKLVAEFEKTKQQDVDGAVIAFVERFQDAADKHAGTDAAVPYLAWIVRNGLSGAAVATAFAALEQSHAASLAIGTVLDVVPNLTTSLGDERCSAFLDRVLQAGSPPELHAKAMLASAVIALQTERRGLEVGDVLPEVAGFDLDGVPFRLSDYRGKVVVLEFWGEC